jgi:hypothetical protein
VRPTDPSFRLVFYPIKAFRKSLPDVYSVALWLVFPGGWIDSQGYILSFEIPALHVSTRGGFSRDTTYSHLSGNVVETVLQKIRINQQKKRYLQNRTPLCCNWCYNVARTDRSKIPQSPMRMVPFSRSPIDMVFEITKGLTVSAFIEYWLKSMSRRRTGDVCFWVSWQGRIKIK